MIIVSNSAITLLMGRQESIMTSIWCSMQTQQAQERMGSMFTYVILSMAKYGKVNMVMQNMYTRCYYAISLQFPLCIQYNRKLGFNLHVPMIQFAPKIRLETMIQYKINTNKWLGK